MVIAYQPRDPPSSLSSGTRQDDQKLLFARERFYVHGEGEEKRCMERYIVDQAGGILTSQSASTFIVVPFGPTYARSFAETLPRGEGGKVIRFEWIKENTGYQITEGDDRLGGGPVVKTEQGRAQLYNSDQVSEGHAGPLHRNNPPIPQYERYNKDDTQEPEDWYENGRRATQRITSDAIPLGNRDHPTQPVSQPLSGLTNHRSNHRGIFKGHVVWVVGAPGQRRYLEGLFISEGGTTSFNLPSATRVVFYPPNRGFEEITKKDHIRGEALYDRGVRCLTYKWVEDCVKAGRLLDERGYTVGKRDLFDNDFWRRVERQEVEDIREQKLTQGTEETSLTREGAISPLVERDYGVDDEVGESGGRVGTDGHQGFIDPQGVAFLLKKLSARVDTVLEAARGLHNTTTAGPAPSQPGTSTQQVLTQPEGNEQARYPTPISPVRISHHQTRATEQDSNVAVSHLGLENIRVRSPFRDLEESPSASSSANSTSKSIDTSQILAGEWIWVVGAFTARKSINGKIKRLGGSLSSRLPESTIVVFCRSHIEEYIMSRVRDYERCLANNCLMVAESWIHDMVFSERAIDPHDYLIENRDVLLNVRVWDVVLLWSMAKRDGERFVGEWDKRLVGGSSGQERVIKGQEEEADRRDLVSTVHGELKEERARTRSFSLDDRGTKFRHVAPPQEARRSDREGTLYSLPLPNKGQTNYAIDPRIALKASSPVGIHRKIEQPIPTSRDINIDKASTEPMEDAIQEVEVQDGIKLNDEEYDDFADLAGISTDEEGQDDTDDDSILTPPPEVPEPVTLTSPAKSSRGRSKGSFGKKRRRSIDYSSQSASTSRSRALNSEKIESITEVVGQGDANSDDSDYAPVKRRKSDINRPAATPSSSLATTTLGPQNQRSQSKIYKHNEVLPKDRERYNELRADLELKIKNDDFPHGLQSYIRSQPGREVPEPV
uniref:BRCT domain-containing protein n=1 Tax=Kwoniella bestiolae CBS 10118 TaxID=1296100 RepID=A0A1B9FVE4_9TREE|nr:hypothetical protein I302_07076 [Kwoniella bestiolae CBS 10118]OCF22736.1 hypothetical protein I302_07076 [Kwoniella bestiolae CBS 10118]